MSVVAVYNMKGGVGKTTTAVNLSYLAAAAGQRTLLWDLDPQAASSFAFRVRPRVAGFGKKSLESGQALAAAIKETDYDNLDLLPADFAYRKLDRLLGHLGKPARVVTALLEHARSRLRRRVPRLPGRLLAVDRGHLRSGRRGARAHHSDRALAANGRTTHQVGRSFRLAIRAGGVLQHGRPPQGTASARMRLVCGPPRGLPDRTSPLRQRRGTDDRPAHAPRRVRAHETLRRPRSQGSGQSSRHVFSSEEKRGPRPRDRWVLLLRAIESLIVRLESAGGQETGASCQVPAATSTAAARRRRHARTHIIGRGSDPGVGATLNADSPGGRCSLRS